MTEAGWTRERPTKNGWYWWRFDASTSATIVRIMVCGDGSLAEMSNNGHLLLAANFDGEWLGPLSPTDRQQGRVAGLREASRKASDAVPLLLGTHPSFANVIADALMDFSDILSEDATKLAQQAAQDEKGVGDGKV